MGLELCLGRRMSWRGLSSSVLSVEGGLKLQARELVIGSLSACRFLFFVSLVVSSHLIDTIPLIFERESMVRKRVRSLPLKKRVPYDQHAHPIEYTLPPITHHPKILNHHLPYPVGAKKTRKKETQPIIANGPGKTNSRLNLEREDGLSYLWSARGSNPRLIEEFCVAETYR